MAWKNTMAVFQTFDAPPRSGSAIFVNKGCTENNRHALTKIDTVNTVIVNFAGYCADFFPDSEVISKGYERGV